MKKKIKKTDDIGAKIGIGVAVGVIAMLLMFPMARAAGLSFMDKIVVGVSEIYGNWLIDQTEEVDFEPSEVFGALSGPDLPYDHLCVSSSCTYYYSGEFLDATTTLFSIAPVFPIKYFDGNATTTGATTTLVAFTVNITGVSTTSMKLKMGTSTVPAIATAADISSSLIDTIVATNTLAFFTNGITLGIPLGGEKRKSLIYLVMTFLL